MAELVPDTPGDDAWRKMKADALAHAGAVAVQARHRQCDRPVGAVHKSPHGPLWLATRPVDSLSGRKDLWERRQDAHERLVALLARPAPASVEMADNAPIGWCPQCRVRVDPSTADLLGAFKRYETSGRKVNVRVG